MSQNPTTGYAPVDGLEIYYEVHGSGSPLILLHGGMTTAEDFALLLPRLAQTMQVVVYERQGHGHTADSNRPMTMAHDTADIAALMTHLNIEKADVLGYSTGGTVALGFAIRYPQRVNKLILVSAIYNEDGYPPEMLAGLRHATADVMPDIMRETYEKFAPKPEAWPELVAKSVAAASTFKGWSDAEMQDVQIPTLILIGDDDIVRREHAVAMSRLMPHSHLAILPATDHVSILFQREGWLSEMTLDFLNIPAE